MEDSERRYTCGDMETWEDEQMTHRFDPTVAEDVGVTSAVIYYDICFWCKLNYDKTKNFSMYSTMKDFQQRHPYLTVNQVRRALDKLRKNGYVDSSTEMVNRYFIKDKRLINSILVFLKDSGNSANHFGVSANHFGNSAKIKKDNIKDNIKDIGEEGRSAHAHTHAYTREDQQVKTNLGARAELPTGERTSQLKEEDVVSEIRTCSSDRVSFFETFKSKKIEDFYNEVKESEIKRQGTMKLLGITSEAEFDRLVAEVVTEWAITDSPADSNSYDWRRLLSHLRIKLEKRDEKNRTGRKSERERYAEYSAYLLSGETGAEGGDPLG